MNTRDDRDLSAAFEELTAPPSTASYAGRTTGLDGRARASRWPQAVAGALAVAVALGAAGTFLALRNARHAAAPSSSPAGPPARSNAAMAYDSTAGVTVMFGGSDASGRTLTDAWTWDGSAWKAAARGPGPLVNTRMVDDPADGGVLLLGVPATPVSSGGSVGSSGCVGSGTATPASVPGSTPIPANGTVRPPNGPVPTDAAAPSSSSAPGGTANPGGTIVPTPGASCPPAPVPVIPTAQTWLFSNGTWAGASGNADSSPPAGAQLAFDTTTHQVVAVSAGFSRCGPPMLSPVANGAAIACPVAATSAKPAVAPDPLCLPVCAPSDVIATWTWSDGSWRKRTTNVQAGPFTFLFTDPGTQHATLMTQSDNGLYDPCPVGESCGVPCSATTPCSAPTACPANASCARPAAQFVVTWTWTGTAWTEKSRLDNVLAPPTVAGGTVTAVDGRILVFTAAGETWRWSAGRWYDDSTPQPGIHPNQRAGAAMAEGPGSTVVLFGGEVLYGFHGVSSPATVGADTWVWSAGSWRHAGGQALPAPPSSAPCSAKTNGVIPPCVQPEPAQVPPAAPRSSAPPSPA